MGISVNVQYIRRARARGLAKFSTVDLFTDRDEHSIYEVSLFIEGPGHEDAAARIAALINEQVVRRDNRSAVEIGMEMHQAIAEADDGPTYDGPDEAESARLDAEQGVSLGAAREAAEEERAYNEEDRLGKEAHLRSVRRDDKPWTPHEDQIEEDVRAGRRDADGEPLTITARVIGGPNAGATFTATADPKDEP